ncbi:MAG: M23 family metallopeptidase, partial [Acidobacteriaceae bacterium]|nr:M23 family metallopeptidase [Acidobacteriaceae bacterium]
MKYLLFAVLAILLAPPLLLLLLSTTPAMELTGLGDATSPALAGRSTPVSVRITDPHGIRSLAAYVTQGDQRFPVYQISNPPHRLLFFKNEPPRQYGFVVGTKSAPGLKDGKATLTVETVSNDLRASKTTLTRDLNVVTIPPDIQVLSRVEKMTQGGCELVVFAIRGFASSSGVKVGNYRFRSFPVPGSPNKRFSLFSFPWDVPPQTAPLVFASNGADEVTKTFVEHVKPSRFRKRDLTIDDAFLERVDNQIDPGGSGDLLTRFLHINRDIRKENNKTLADLRLKTEERFLWNGPFLGLPNSAIESYFADARSYMYHGKKVDEQVHLGFDLAKLKNSPIQASNDGKVLLAEKLGIYGNCVVIDHGNGVTTLYGHCSVLLVSTGDVV